MAFWDIWPQVLAAFLCNVSILSFGLQAGWLSPLQPAFQSENSPIGGPPLTDEEISWFGAIPSISLTISAPFFGWIMTRYGRRMTLLVATAPNIITYLLLIVANNFITICISRAIGGFCSCGSFIVGPIYVNELVEQHLKGILGSITGFFIKFGIILSFILGAYTSYLTLNLISGSFTVIFMFIYPWLPESPVYLVTKGKISEADSALRKVRLGKPEESIADELKQLQESTLDIPEDRTALQYLKSFSTDIRLRNAIIIVLCIYGFQMLSGYPAIVRYAVDVVSDAGSVVSSYNAAILFAVAQLTCSGLGSFLLDRLGRKTLIVCNLFLLGTCSGCMSIYIYLNSIYPDSYILQNLKALPTVALVIFFCCYALGFGTVPFVIIAELFGPDTRAFASTTLNMWFAFVEFVVVKLFPTLSGVFNLYGAVGIVSIFSFIGSGLLYWRMFETKGLSYEEIQRKLCGEKVYGKGGKVTFYLPVPKTRPHC